MNAMEKKLRDTINQRTGGAEVIAQHETDQFGTTLVVTKNEHGFSVLCLFPVASQWNTSMDKVDVSPEEAILAIFNRLS